MTDAITPALKPTPLEHARPISTRLGKAERKTHDFTMRSATTRVCIETGRVGSDPKASEYHEWEVRRGVGYVRQRSNWVAQGWEE